MTKKETEKKIVQKFSAPKLIIKKPRVTEKSANLTDQAVFVFEIAPDANKQEVKKEIQRIYKVKPVKVNIAKSAKKKVFVRGKKGVKSGVKKAYVFLDKKDAGKIKIM